MRFERRLKPMTTVDLTPLIDVVFQLVIFFMVSSVFKTAPGIPLDLPGSSSAEAVTVNELRIKVLESGQIFVNYETTDLNGLPNAIQTFMDSQKGNAFSAMVEGDAAVTYQTMVRVLDELRLRGITEVGMLTGPMEAGRN